MGQTILLVLTCLCSLSFGRKRVYHFHDDFKNCTEARQYCQKYYTDLATVHRNTVSCVCPIHNCNGAWIRICRVCNDINWCWLGGEEYRGKNVSWENKQLDGKCVYVSNLPLRWNTAPCDSKNQCICYDALTNRSDVGDSSHYTWVEAVEYCRKKNTSLISGHEKLRDLNITHLGGYATFWIGLYKTSGQGLPENVLCQKPDKYAVISGNNWKDEPCEQNRPFICYDDYMVLIKESMTWEEALNYCRKNYDELAVMTDDDQLKIVQAKATMADTEFVWVGLHFSCFFEEWIWANGHWVSSDDRNWENRDEESECGVSGAMAKNGKWVKKKSNEQYNFVCSLKC